MVKSLRRNPIAKAVKRIRPKVVPDTKRKKLEAARVKDHNYPKCLVWFGFPYEG